MCVCVHVDVQGSELSASVGRVVTAVSEARAAVEMLSGGDSSDAVQRWHRATQSLDAVLGELEARSVQLVETAKGVDKVMASKDTESKDVEKMLEGRLAQLKANFLMGQHSTQITSDPSQQPRRIIS